MSNYKDFGKHLKNINYSSWGQYVTHMNFIEDTLKEEGFEKITSVPDLQILFKKLEVADSFLKRTKHDQSTILSVFRRYIKYISELHSQMQVWRIDSNLGDGNISSIFKEYNLCFAGKDLEVQIQKVKFGDLVAITNDQLIIAVGKVDDLENLKSVNTILAEKYEDVTAIKMSPFYFKENFQQIDFGMYDGQVNQFHEADGKNVEKIKSLFKSLSTNNMFEDNEYENIKSVLKYKKQIILQGPPGTGKTFMAKRIAEEMTQTMSQGSAMQKIDNFFKSFNSNAPDIIEERIKMKQLIEKFHKLFPKEELKNLSLKDYAIGTGSNDSFCWWIEIGLKPIGYYFPGNSKAYLIFWSADNNCYTKKGKVSNETDSDAMKIIANVLSEFIINRDFEKASEYFGDSFLLKVLQSYYPDEYMPINSVSYLDRVLKIFNVPGEGMNPLEKNLKVQELFLKKKAEFGTNVTNIEFMSLLCVDLGLKEDITNSNIEVTRNGEFKIIQFHPSFTYEDFVRGIIADSNGDKVEYKTVNKVLGEFANEAKKNWDDYNKESGNISKEIKTREYFELFTDHINHQLAEEGTVLKLTQSVNLTDVDEDAFRYKGNDGWSPLGNRMLFKDIIQAFLDGNNVRQDIKRNTNLSGLAIQHATYFVRVLNMFQEYLVSNNLTFDNLEVEKVELKNYILIIDEINRANLPSVLGELIYALEYRDEAVESMYEVDGRNDLIIPPNLYIIGTMNTADRSVGHIDYAIRRRFAFVDVLPSSDVINDNVPDPLKSKAIELFNKVSKLFAEGIIAPDFKAKDVQLGHSYFLAQTEDELNLKLNYEIKPLLKEYLKDGILLSNVSNNVTTEDYIDDLSF